MPKISKYLDRISPSRTFDDAELARLQSVYERACEIHGIEVGDPRRETIAILVFRAADLTSDTGEMLERVLDLFGPS